MADDPVPDDPAPDDPVPDDPAPDEPGWATPNLPPRAPAGAATPSEAPPPSAAWTSPATPTGSTPTGATPAVAPGAPVRRSKAWLVILVIVLAGIVITGVAGSVLFVDRTLPPIEAASDFLDDLGDGRAVRAAEQLCSADRERPAAALRVVTVHFPGGRSVSVNPLTVDRDDDRATLEYTIDVGGDDSDDRTYELPLRYEGSDWRPCPGDTLR